MKGSLFHNMWRFDRTLSPDRARHAPHSSLLNFCTHLHALPSFSLPSARFRNFPTLQLAPDTFGSVPFKAYPTSPTSQLQRNESPYDWELSARASHETLLFTCKSSSLLPPTPSSFNVETMVCVLLFFVTTTNTIKQFLRNNCVPHNPVPEKSTLSLSLSLTLQQIYTLLSHNSMITIFSFSFSPSKSLSISPLSFSTPLDSLNRVFKNADELQWMSSSQKRLQ